MSLACLGKIAHACPQKTRSYLFGLVEFKRVLLEAGFGQLLRRKRRRSRKKPFWFQVFSLSRVVVPSLSWHVQDRFFSLTKLLRENKTLPKRVRAIPHLGRGAKPVAVSAAVVVAHVPGPARACARGAKGGQRCVSDARSGAELSRRGERAALLPAGEQR